MTLLYMNGFDHFDNGAESMSTLELLSSGVTCPNWGSGRFSYGRYLASYTNFYNGWIGKGKLGVSTLYMGFALRISDLGWTYTYYTPMLTFNDINNYENVKFHVVGKKFDVRRGETNTQLFSPVEFFDTANKWYYIEIKLVISATVGEVVIKVDGIQIKNQTGLNTKHSSGSTTIDKIFLGGGNNKTSNIDDLYIDDAQFHGPCRIKTFFPDSVSSTNNDFTASAGNKDECVDENSPNYTDYITSDTLNHKQTFGITTGELEGSVKGINIINVAEKTDAGDRKFKPLVRSNGTNYQGAEETLLGGYVGFNEIFEIDPDDAGAWTQTKLEAAEFGLEITT